MKKLTPGFFLLLFACSSPKQAINNSGIFTEHQQPYHVFAVGKWDHNYTILTLIDARQNYFTIKSPYNATIKDGDIYIP